MSGFFYVQERRLRRLRRMRCLLSDVVVVSAGGLG